MPLFLGEYDNKIKMSRIRRIENHDRDYFTRNCIILLLYYRNYYFTKNCVRYFFKQVIREITLLNYRSRKILTAILVVPDTFIDTLE